VASPIGAGSGADLHLKLENHQHTGSFKIRGAFSKLLSLSAGERARGVIAASTGNPALQRPGPAGAGVPVRVVVSGNADP
jgi:threonine dehydratase